MEVVFKSPGSKQEEGSSDLQPTFPGLELPPLPAWEDAKPFRKRVVGRYPYQTAAGVRDVLTLTEHEDGRDSSFIIAESRREGVTAFMYPEKSILKIPGEDREVWVYHTPREILEHAPPDPKTLLPGIDWNEFIALKRGDWHPYQENFPDMAFSKRGCTLEAFKDMAEKLCSKFFPGQPTVAELGPGTGFLYSILPEVMKKNWIQVEWNPKYLQELRKRFPEADIRPGMAESLPFLPGILDAVVGYGSYDTVRNIRGAIASAAARIKKGGLFMHIMDTNPDPEAVREWLKQEGKFFPKVIRGSMCRGTHVEEGSDYFESEDILREYDQARAEDLAEFGDEYKYGERSRALLEEHGKSVDFMTEYKRILCELLQERGFAIEFNGDIKGHWEGPREDRHYIKDSSYWQLPDDPKYNYLKKFEGVHYVNGTAWADDYLKDRPTPPTIRERVTVDLIAARK